MKYRVILFSTLATLLVSGPAGAVPIYWKGDGAGTGSWNSAGTWSTTTDGTGAGQIPGALDVATFNITALNDPQTISLDANQAALGLSVASTGAIALQGGGTDRTLNLGTSGILLDAGAGPLTIGSATAGQGVALSLQGNQSWTNNSGAASTSAIVINNGVSAGTSGTLTLTLGGNTSPTTFNTINGVLSDGSGTIAVTMNSGIGTRWVLAGPNTYSGLTTVTSGILRVTHSSGLGSAAQGTTVAANGVLSIESAGTIENEALTITGSGPTGAASGALQSNAGNNTWTGSITANTGGSAGIARIGAHNSSVLTIEGDITATGTGQLVFQTGNTNTNTGTILVNGDISFAGGRLTKSATGASSGITILAGSNTYDATIISGGILQIGNGGTTGNLGTGTVSIASAQGGTLAFKRSDNITVGNSLSGAGTVSHLSTATVTLTGANALTGATNVTLGGTLVLDFTGLADADPQNIAGTGTFTIAGSSKLNMVGKSTGTSSQTFAGTTIQAGGSSITLDSNGGTATNLALGNIVRTVTGGTLALTLPASGGFTAVTANTNGILGGYIVIGGTDWASSAGNGTVAGAVTALASYTNDTWAAGNNTTVTTSSTQAATSTTNSLRFNAAGAATVTLSGTNTISSGGILVTANVGANLSTITGGTLATGAGADLIVFQNNTSGGLTIASVLANSLTKSGDGLLTLTGNSGANITFRINAGTISVSAPSNLGGGATNIIVFNVGSTGTFQFTGNNTFSSAKTMLLNGNGTVEVLQAASFTAQNAISGVGNLTKTGAGTLRLTHGSNANAYTGATIINGGAIQVTVLANGGTTSGIGASSNAASNLVLNGGGLQYVGTTASATDRLFTLGTAGGTLDASAALAANTMSFTNTGSVAFAGSGARTLTLTGTNTGANTLAVALGDGSGGATSVQKTDAGAWTMSGSNSYSGGTTIVAGSLSGATNGAFGTGNVTVQNATGASLTIQTGVLDAIANSATLSLAGGGAVNVADAGFAMLVAGVNESVGGLILGGVTQTNLGTYGATGSGATYVFDEYFSGAGVITLIPEPGSASILAVSLGGLLGLQRLRRRRTR